MSKFLGMIFGFTVFSISIFAQQENPTYQRIRNLLAPYGDKAGFSLRTLDGHALFEVNAQRNFSPASTAKIFSSACVLDALGADFQFETPWGYQGFIKDGVLHGDLIIRGKADFSFVIEDLKMIVEYLRFAHGIREITGRLLFDTSYFTSPKIAAYTGFDGDVGRAFQSSLTALPINHNAFAVWVVPEQLKPRIEIFPQGAIELQTENKLSLVKGRLGGSQTTLDFRPQLMRLILSGKVGNQDPIKIYYRSLPDAYDSFSRLFEFNFTRLGGKWTRQWAVGASIESAKILWTHRSRSMSRLLIDINKLSTNFGAEMALLTATAEKMGTPVDLNKSATFLQSCLNSFGIQSAEVQLKNASGLSRESSAQPEAMTRFLSALSNKAYFPEFLSTLSVLGQDGTTRSRLKSLAAKARLKTGTLADTQALTGYIFPASTIPRSMSLILNCKNCDFNKWQKVEDQILELLIRSP